MKKLGIACIALLAFSFALALFFTYYPALQLGAKSFLWCVSSDQHDTAYQMMSPNFQKQVTQQNFIKMVQQNHLDQYKDVKWDRSEISTDKKTGFVQGQVITDSGRSIPIRFDFVHLSSDTVLEKQWLISKITILR
jgi:hypothetical protein